MANPPDPHVYKGRNTKVMVIIAIIVVIGGLAFVFSNRPGAGMGGSMSGEKTATAQP
jgi:hypothetical protein